MTVENMIVEAGPLSEAIVSITGTDEGTMIVTTQDNRMTLYAAGKRVVFEAPVADITVDADFSPGYVKAVVEDLDIKASIWREIIENGADDGMNPDASAGAHLVKV